MNNPYTHINDLESSIADINKDKRPSQVMMVIITDGQENASDAFSSLSDRTSAYRSNRSAKMEFMEEDRKHEADPNRKKVKH